MGFIQIQFRKGTASEWATANPTLARAEIGVETDTGLFKIGNGSSNWNSLTYSSTYWSSLVGRPDGLISSSVQLPSGLVSSSTQVSYTSLQNIPEGLISSSIQFPIGIISSSTQINTLTDISSSFATTASAATSITFIPSTASFATTASYVFASGLPAEIVSSSEQINYTQLQNVPNGIVSSSEQISIQNTTGFSAIAITGSNTFTGNQVITGSLFISNNLTVLGSSSIQYITQSTLNIGTNLITVNTNQPSSRYGGLAVIDSASLPQISGSLLFDSTKNQWLFIHQNQNVVTSSLLVMHAPTYDDVGNEITLTINSIPKAVGKEHIGNSQITDDGTTVSISNGLSVGSNLTSSGADITALRATSITGSVSGTLSGTFSFNELTNIPIGIISSSGQVDYTQLQNISLGIVSSSTQINLLPDVSASFATTASAATSITFIPSTASFALSALSSSYTQTASLALNGETFSPFLLAGM